MRCAVGEEDIAAGAEGVAGCGDVVEEEYVVALFSHIRVNVHGNGS